MIKEVLLKEVGAEQEGSKEGLKKAQILTSNEADEKS